MLSVAGDVGPFDFLYCKKCERHLDRNPILDFRIDAIDYKMSRRGRAERVAPKVNFEVIPTCPDCRGRVIQKYVTVVVNLDP